MTKDEAVEKGFIIEIEPNPLWKLCEQNSLISVDWIKKNLTPEQFADWQEKSK
jgi:hypothetical protein